jgi:hypothetical protein
MNNYALEFVVIVMLIFAYLGDLMQIAVRVIISVVDQPNLSTHLVTLSLLINRFGASLGLLLIGFLIDSGTSVASLSVTYALSALCIAMLYSLTGSYPRLGPHFLVPFIRHYYKLDITHKKPVFEMPTWWQSPIDVALVNALAILGFVVPSLLAVAIPDFRATLLQSGFILNSLGTLYSALSIEKRLALTLNHGSESEKWVAYVTFMRARSIGSVVAAGVLICTLPFV